MAGKQSSARDGLALKLKVSGKIAKDCARGRCAQGRSDDVLSRRANELRRQTAIR